MFNPVKHLFDAQLKQEYNSRSNYLQKCFDYSWNLYSKDLKSHYGCVNALEFSNRESEHFASGGDDKRVLIWSINNDIFSSNQANPIALNYQHQSNIFTLAWDNENKRIFSGGNDDSVIVHDVETRQMVDVFLHPNPVFCISVHPEQSEIFASACENGQVCLYDLRLSNTDPIILSSTPHGSAYQACSFNPVNASLIATANIDSGIQLIDLRMQNRVIMKYKANISKSNKSNTTSSSSGNKIEYEQNVMSIKFNRIGTQLIALRCKLPPVLYNLNDSDPLYQFYHDGFLNSCTLKTCCFVGDRDQYVCSGSDDFCVYIWKIPSFNRLSDDTDESEKDASNRWKCDEAHLKLKGHRSIVNQVRYNPNFHLLLSSGVEKLIKCWTPYKMPNSIGGLLGKPEERMPDRKLFTNRQLFDMRRTGLEGDPTIDESIEEDQTMIAFFDSLVRRDMQNWLSTEDEDDLETVSEDHHSDSDSDSDDSSGDSDSSSSSSSSNSTKLNDLIDLHSDNNDDQNTRSSTSTTTSGSDVSFNFTPNAISNSQTRNRRRVSLRDRLRNLRHRRSLNLTENSEYINVLDSLNVPHSSASTSSIIDDASSNKSDTINIQSKQSSAQTASSCPVESPVNASSSSQSVALTTVNEEKDTKNLKLIKTLNEKRRIIDLSEDEDENENEESTIVQPSTSSTTPVTSEQTKFKSRKKIKCKENNNNTNTNCNNEPSASSTTTTTRNYRNRISNEESNNNIE